MRAGTASLLFYVLCAVFLLLSFVSLDIIYEDAFIYFRLVEQLADGQGYTFNRFGDAVEYCTSLLWPLLIWLVSSLTSLNLVTIAKVLGILLALINLFFVYQLCRRLLTDRAAQLIPVLLTVTYAPFVLWSQMGLETALYSLLLTLLTFSLVAERYRRHWPWLAIALILARSEGMFFVAGLLALLFIFCPQQRPGLPRALLYTGAAMIVLSLFRFFYFHDLLPTPFYTKIGSSPFTLAQLHDHLVWHGTYLLLLLAAPAFVWSKFWNEENRVLAIVAGLSLFWFAFSYDYGPFFRHATYAMPLLFLLVVRAFEFLTGNLKQKWKNFAYAGFLLFALSGVTLQPSAFTFGERMDNFVFSNIRQVVRAPVERSQHLLARFLRPDSEEHLGGEPPSGLYGIGNNPDALIGRFVAGNYPEGTVLVYDQMGQTPYYAGPGRAFIDSWGLVHQKISHMQFRRSNQGKALHMFYLNTAETLTRQAFDESWLRTREEAVDAVFAAEPDVIMLHGLILVDPVHRERLPSLIFRDKRLSDQYRLCCTVLYTHVYERRDFEPERNELVVPEGLNAHDLFSHEELLENYQ